MTDEAKLALLRAAIRDLVRSIHEHGHPGHIGMGALAEYSEREIYALAVTLISIAKEPASPEEPVL